MAKVRIGFSTQFELENELVGIGTDNPTNTLQALGNIKSSDAKAVGVTTLTTFDGFVDTKASISGLEGSEQGSISGEIIIEGGVTVSSGATFRSGPENFTATDNFTLPGISDDKPSVGTMRFNEDLRALEFYTGSEWRAVNSRVDMGTGGRAIFFGGYHQPTFASGYNGKQVDFFNMITGGLSQNFGENSANARTNTSGSGNAIRGISANAYNGPGQIGNSNSIEYVTIASAGNVVDFGDRTVAGYGGQALSSSTRGIFLGIRDTNNRNVIDYIEIPTVGNAIDFGDLVANGGYKAGNLNSPTRGFVAGGSGPLGNASNDIQMITIASKGNAIEIGDIPRTTDNSTGASNSVRGIISGGYSPSAPNAQNAVIADLYYMNLASQGNAFSFGELTASRQRCGGTANGTRAIFAGGFSYPGSVVNTESIDYVTIVSEGHAVDFGTIVGGKHQFGATSDSHGGLGGF